MTMPLWQPNEDQKQASNLRQFMAALEPAAGRKISSYDQLFEFSLKETSKFWSQLWDFAGVIGDKGGEPFLIDGDRMPGAAFFTKARLNYAETLLRKEGAAAALVFRGEDKVARQVSREQLRAEVAKAAAAFDDAGVAAGDRIAAIMPNMPEAIIAMLGGASRGAVWSSCSPDFGVQGILDRFGQIAPKVLIACDGYYYNGKTIDISDKLAEVAAKLPSVERVIVVSYLGNAGDVVQGLNLFLGRQDRVAMTWDDAVSARPAADLSFTPLPFSHPLYILFSSGTTGAPKCIVHSAGGILMKHLSEQMLHCDLKPGDKLFFFTTCGWMMWNWLVSGLACGATLMLYDGSPFHPSGKVLFDYADAEGFTIFGTSAKFIDALKKNGLRPRDTHSLASVRMLMSTGSVLVPEGFDYVYDAIKPDVHLASISGGTDIAGCFVLGNPLKPVWRGEIQGAALGMKIDVYDDDGKPMPRGKGELVCANAFPSMPIGFLDDPGEQKYKAAYFSRFENVWHHGDFAEWSAHGGMIIHGRSDATLNPGGVRIGTAEIYRQVEQLSQVQEAVVIGQDWDGDVRVVLFVVLKPGLTLDDALRDAIKKKIRSGASPRHVPHVILQVTDIPRTKSGKITELAIRDIVHGRPIKNKEALANPEALALYEDIEELKR